MLACNLTAFQSEKQADDNKNLKTGQKLDSNNILLEITIMEGITMNIETYLEDLKIRDKRNKKS